MPCPDPKPRGSYHHPLPSPLHCPHRTAGRSTPFPSPHGKWKTSKLKYAQVFSRSKASWKDGGIMVGCTELGQVCDRATGDPCRLGQNIPGKEHRAKSLSMLVEDCGAGQGHSPQVTHSTHMAVSHTGTYFQVSMFGHYLERQHGSSNAKSMLGSSDQHLRTCAKSL